MDRLFYILLGIFLLLYGVVHVTNLQMVWTEPLCSIAALVAGVICLLQVFYRT
jgi:hypothetical protein